ncbi:MAG: phosphoadenosine phosphosulfate reductase family protein [Octadecabacter sp.]|nr:phosphoadenosine phosphosulfate reductase family protein [Octadecabacter sp.]
MPLDGQAQTLNRIYKNCDAQDVLGHALNKFGNMALVISFSIESAILLHLAVQIYRKVLVLFISTEILLVETLNYQCDVAEKLGLTNVQVTLITLFKHDDENLLRLHDPYACCKLRKTEPLQKALLWFDGWISWRKRYQGGVCLASNLSEVDQTLGQMPQHKN